MEPKNFGDLTPYLTYIWPISIQSGPKCRMLQPFSLNGFSLTYSILFKISLLFDPGVEYAGRVHGGFLLQGAVSNRPRGSLRIRGRKKGGLVNHIYLYEKSYELSLFVET
jgi:hypothetical protein